MKNKNEFDVIIIGAGVIGCFIARELSIFDLEIAVVEKSSYVCSGQSKANGAIVHGGHDPKPDTLKAKFNAIPSMFTILSTGYQTTGI